MIKATSVQASRANNVVIHTIECVFPINILNQLLTHRAFSRNTSSARAVPITAAIDQIANNPSIPMWTKKGKGMSGDPITDPDLLNVLGVMHKHNTATAMSQAMALDSLGVHKQNAGRCLTPYQDCKLLLTSTDWANFDWLRDDKDAQPEIRELAKAIIEARNNAEIMDLEFGEYHVPYIKRHRAVNGELEYYIEDSEGYNLVCLDHAIMVSMSINAQISYRKSDGSLEKAETINELLFNGHKVHASPSEHIATPMLESMVNVFAKSALGQESGLTLKDALKMIQDGTTSINVDGTLASGNLTNWVQHRQSIPNHDAGVGEHVQKSAEPSAEDKDKIMEGITDIITSLAEAFTEEGIEDIDESTINFTRPSSLEEFEALSEENQAIELSLAKKDVQDALAKMKD